MKKCKKCEIEKEIISSFYFKKTRNHYDSWCKTCRLSSSHYYSKKSIKVQFSRAWYSKRYFQTKNNAEKRNIPFSLTIDEYMDIKRRDGKCFYCELIFLNEHLNERQKWMTIDRVKNSLGYSKENCVLSCYECNRIKSNLCLDQRERIMKIFSKMIE